MDFDKEKLPNNVDWGTILMLLILATLDISHNEENNTICYECKKNKLKNNEIVCEECRNKLLNKYIKKL